MRAAQPDISSGGINETACPRFDSLPTQLLANQDRVTMVRALRQWLEAHELPAIIAGVLGVVIAFSLLLVVGGYLLVTP